MANYGKVLTYSGGKVRFGTYCVALDTLAPTIRFVETKNNIVSGRTIRARVRDEASGVASARVEIDGKWYLSMLRSGTVSLELRDDRIRRGRHTIKITVTDNCGNESYATRTFNY